MDSDYVGEVINDRYKVVQVQQKDAERVVYKCTRLSDNAQVMVECLRICETRLFGFRNAEGARKQELLKAEMANDSTVVDSFEANDRNGKKYYVVKLTDQQQGAEVAHEHLRIDCPVESRSAVYAFGVHHLEIDVPCRGVDEGYGLLEILFSFVPFAALSFLLYRGIHIVVVRSAMDVGLLGFVIFLNLVWLYCLYTLLKKPRSLFGHTNITITPDEFQVKTTLELTPQSRDSVNHPIDATKGPSVLDRIFCDQVNGRTSGLNGVETRVRHGQHGSKRWLVLREGDKEHEILLHVSKEELQWLENEVKRVLNLETP